MPGTRLESPDPSFKPTVNQSDDFDLKDHQESLEEFNPQDLTGEDQKGGFAPEGENNLDLSRGYAVQKSGGESKFLDQESRILDDDPEILDSPRNVSEGMDLPPNLDGAGPEKIYQSLPGIRLSAFPSNANKTIQNAIYT